MSQMTAHMHGHHEATMGLAGPSLGRELRARALIRVHVLVYTFAHIKLDQELTPS